METPTRTNKLHIDDEDSITFTSGNGTTRAGFRWANGVLVHRGTGQTLHFSPEMTQEIEDAIARCRPFEEVALTGGQVFALPESERAAYKFSHLADDGVNGIYIKETQGHFAVVYFGKSDLQ